MAELKQSRWVKIHEPGQANFIENENIMDIMIGADCCQAEATYTVRSYKKVAYWLVEYLKAAEALQIIANEIITQIQEVTDNAKREDNEVAANGDGWNCEIEKMSEGNFKVHLRWSVKEPVTKKGKSKNVTSKKRNRKKEEEK